MCKCLVRCEISNPLNPNDFKSLKSDCKAFTSLSVQTPPEQGCFDVFCIRCLKENDTISRLVLGCFGGKFHN